MSAFETAIYKAIDSSMRSTIKGYISEFADILTQKINKKEELDTKSISEIWNNIVKDTDFKPGRKNKKDKEIDLSHPCCEHMISKGDRKDQQCGEQVSKKSSTQSYCSKHYKQNEKDKSTDICSYTLKKGDKKDEKCGKNCVKDSEFCSKHKSNIKKKEDKKKNKKGSKNKKDNKKKNETKTSENVSAKVINSGKLKGMCYFEKDDEKYVFEKTSKIVKGTLDGDELKPLTKDQIKIVKQLGKFKVESSEEDDESDIPNLEKEDEKDEDSENEDDKSDDEKNEEDSDNEISDFGEDDVD
jgi:hypothetical protein